MVEVEKMPIDRISLTPSNRKRVDKWLELLEEKLQGMAKITRTDLVNSLLELRSQELSQSEIQMIAKNSFDEVRWLNYAVERLKSAKKNGESLSMDQLLEERNSLLGESIKASRGRPKGQKKDPEESSRNLTNKGETST